MPESANRSIKAGLGFRIEVQAGDIPNDTLDSQHYAAGSIDLEHLANETKAGSLVLFDFGPTSATSGAQLTNKRVFTNYSDQKLIFAGFDFVAFERLSVTSGSTCFLSLDTGTTAMAGLNRTSSLAGGTTTAFTNGTVLSLASGASVRMRASAYTAGGFSRFSKIIGHYRAATV